MAVKNLPNPTQRVPPYPGGSPQIPNGGNLPGAPSTYVPLSNGGVFGVAKMALYPCFNALDNTCEFMGWDPTSGFDDPVNPSSYNFKVEDFLPYRTATVRRIIVTYTDLGQVTAVFTLTGCNDNQEVVDNTATVVLGNETPTQAILTQKVDLQLTAMNQQLNISRAADAGPLSLTKVWIIGQIEENTL
jgi:hypothetical protein